MKFVLATSGGGGHLFPALKCAEELRSRGHEIIFVGGFAQGIEEIKKRGFAFELLRVHGFTGGIKNRILFFVYLIQAFFRSLSILRQEKVDRVIGFGGYGAVAVVLAAWTLKLPIIIHEQNVVPGRANQFLVRFVRKIAISFPESKKYFPTPKVVFTGCPSNWQKKEFNRSELYKNFGLRENYRTILVIGGSQGSARINREVVKSFGLLKDQMEFQVIHACGAKDYDFLKEEYNKLRIPVSLFVFLKTIDQAYAISDLVVSRAGAASVTEIALSERRAILIPYPFAGGHQKENARALVQTGLAEMIEEKELTAEDLKLVIQKLLSLGTIDSKIKSKIAEEFPSDSAWRLAQAAIHLN